MLEDDEFVAVKCCPEGTGKDRQHGEGDDEGAQPGEGGRLRDVDPWAGLLGDGACRGLDSGLRRALGLDGLHEGSS